MVDLEALAEAELSVEHEAGDGGPRAIARRLQRLGERHIRGGYVARAVPAGPVDVGIDAGHQAGVRGERQRAGAGALGKAHAVARELVEVRRVSGGVAIAAQVVGAGGVEGNQEEVELGRRWLVRGAHAEPGETGDGAEGNCDPEYEGQATGTVRRRRLGRGFVRRDMTRLHLRYHQEAAALGTPYSQGVTLPDGGRWGKVGGAGWPPTGVGGSDLGRWPLRCGNSRERCGGWQEYQQYHVFVGRK